MLYIYIYRGKRFRSEKNTESSKLRLRDKNLKPLEPSLEWYCTCDNICLAKLMEARPTVTSLTYEP